MQTQKKDSSVESIRGWACVMVLMSHFSLTFYPYLHAFDGKTDYKSNPIQFIIHESPFGFFFSGTSAVFIFFVLSGFILTKVATNNGSESKKILLMILKRYPRLMIPALASCLIAYAAIYSFNVTSPQLSNWINTYGNSQEYSLLGAFFSGAIDVFFLSGQSAYNPVLWTMKIELFGSLVVYILCLNRVTLKIPFLVGIVLLITIAAIFLKAIGHELGLGLISFYGGHLFSIYGRKISSQKSLALAMIGLYLAGAHNNSSSYSVIYSLVGWRTYIAGCFLSGFFIVYAIIYSDMLNNLFSGKFSVFLGKVSFSVYLIHLPIISTFGLFAFNTVFHFTDMYDFSAAVASISSVIVIYYLSLCFYEVIDSKSMTISNYFSIYVFDKIQKFITAMKRTVH